MICVMVRDDVDRNVSFTTRVSLIEISRWTGSEEGLAM
jgi:hypothetical protein